MVVSVFVDTSGTCKPGATTNLQKPKKFLGNGVLITRDYAKYKGPVIKMMERITNSPSIDLNLIPPNFVRGQHFPSIICPRILDPKPDEVVLDISGYAGMETSHIAALMGNKGKVIALQRDAARIDQFTKRHKEFGCTNIRIFHLDFEKLVKQNGAKNIKDFDYRPPFPKGSFDRILVDADCSYLGLRPLIFYPQNGRSMASWQPRQKKLFTS
ncbi:putative methyltransferase NSUN6, partial [Diachasma alloeum]